LVGFPALSFNWLILNPGAGRVNVEFRFHDP
jgi:hypothetical protein